MSMKDRVDKAYSAGAAKKHPIVPPEESFPPDPPAPGGRRAPGRPAAGGTARGGPAHGGAAKAGKGGAPSKSLALGEALAAAEGEAAVLLKTGTEPGIAKAAKFLLLLGTEEASKVLAHLSAEEVEAVSREILKVKSIDAPEANGILAEFGWLVRTKGWSVEGGPETAEKMLATAFGPERARALLRKAAPETQRPFKFLADFDAKDLHLLLKGESVQVLSVILPYLEPKKASLIIERLPEEERVEVVKRVARLEKVDPEALRSVEAGLRERVRKIGTVSHEEIDGQAALAGILKHVDPRFEERMLGALEEESPELSKSVRDRLFTLEDVLRVPARALQKALRDFQDRDLALVLKGRDEAFKQKLLSNVSAGRRALILDEYSVLGPVRREDANEAAKEFLGYLKRAWEDGEIALEGEDEMVD